MTQWPFAFLTCLAFSALFPGMNTPISLSGTFRLSMLAVRSRKAQGALLPSD